MYIILKIALTIDAYIAKSDKRLLISSAQDLEQVDKIRSEVDAILIGANTLRVDNPSLLSKKSSKQPIRVVLSRNAEFSRGLKIFTDKKSRTIVYHSNKNVTDLNEISNLTEFRCFENLSIDGVLSDLSKQGVKKLLVEGGAEVFKQFYEKGFFSELRVSVGNSFLGKSGVFLDLSSNKKLKLISVTAQGSSVVHTYFKKQLNCL